MTKEDKKQLILFFLVAFGLPYALGPAFYYGRSQGLDLSLLPLFQMMTPALGAILALLFTRHEDQLLPRKFFGLYILASLGLLALALASVLLPRESYETWANLWTVGLSVGLLVAYFLEPQEKRRAYQLHWPNKKRMVAMVACFLVLYLVRSQVTSYLGGEDLWEFFGPDRLILALVLIPNFFLSFLPFFGEEYGWRYFLQPHLQKKFGVLQGVLLLGLLWGFWHLPINLFYYASPGTGWLSLLNQLVVCMTMSLFMAAAYQYSKNIWTAVWIHYLNNNYILLFVETMDPSVLENNVFSWSVIIFNLIGSCVFLLALFSKYLREQRRRALTPNELVALELASQEEEV